MSGDVLAEKATFSMNGADKWLKDICLKGLESRFGKCPPEAVIRRLLYELEVVGRNHHSSYYLLAIMLSKEAERLHHAFFFRGVITSTLIAYTSGISDVNPMGREYGGIDLPFEIAGEEYLSKKPCLEIQCSMAFVLFAQSFLCREFPRYRYLSYPCQSMDNSGIGAIRLYFVKPDELPDIDPVDTDGVDPDEYPDLLFYDDYFHITLIGDSRMELMRYNKYYEPQITFDEANCDEIVPELWKYLKKNDYTLKAYRRLKVRTYDELIKVASMAYSTDVWNGLLKEKVLDGQLPLADIIGSRDDMFLYLVKIGFDRQTAFTISDRVRKGKGLTDSQKEILKEHGAEDWVIDLCEHVRYMFPKAHVAQLIRKGAFCLKKPD